MGKKAKIKGKMCEVEAERAKSLSRKVLGLILERKIYPLLFEFTHERRWSFHTFLVIKPIDFLFIDKNKRVVEIKCRPRPFNFSIKPQKPVKYVLELPEGMGHLFRVGEKLKF